MEMITRVTAEFESPELADIAINQVKEKTKGFCSASTSYRKSSVKAEKLVHGEIYTLLPTAVTSHNYVTGVIESPASKDVIPEPDRSKNTTLTIVCDESYAKDVKTVLNSAGALKIK